MHQEGGANASAAKLGQGSLDIWLWASASENAGLPNGPQVWCVDIAAEVSWCSHSEYLQVKVPLEWCKSRAIL